LGRVETENRSDASQVRIDLDPSSAPLLPSGDPWTADYRRAVLDFSDDEIFVIAM
jgi:hypothetical protein